MQTTKLVHLGTPLRAAAAVLDGADNDSPFRAWFDESGWLMKVTAPTPEVRAVLAEVPRDAAGTAWVEAAERAVALAEADLWRPWDTATLDTPDELAAAEELAALVDQLRYSSPLLEPVADAVDDQVPFDTFDLGDVTEARGRITDAGIVVGNRGSCDKHDDACYGDRGVVVPWEHVEFLAPGTRARILPLLAALDANLPEVGPDDVTGRIERAGD